jgi:hypothetical protein
MEIKIKMEPEDIPKILKGIGNVEQPAESVVEKRAKRADIGQNRVPWSKREKAWLKKQARPTIDNGHHRQELKEMFGNIRTAKSIDACWRRLTN